MAYFNEFPENQPQDKPKMEEATRKGDGSAASSWNEKAASRTDRTLSAQERAERKKVEGLPGSIGREFNEVPKEQNVDNYLGKRSASEKEALKDPNSVVVLTCTASRTGDAGYNKRLTQRSGEAVKRILRNKGVKAKIKIEAVGYDESQPVGDDRFARQVHVDIYPPEKQADNGKKPAEIDKDTEKDLTELPKKPKEYDFEKEVRDRLKDVPDILKGKFVKQILKEIGKLAKTYLEAVGELKAANKRAAELTGIENGLKMVTQDWLLGRGPHIKEGKPFTPEELKGRLKPLEARDMHQDMQTLKFMNRAGDQDLDRGFKIAADALNRVLGEAKTPAQRQAKLRSFVKTILPKLARNRQKRLAEIRGKK